MNNYYKNSIYPYLTSFFLISIIFSGCIFPQDSDNNENIAPIITDCQVNYFDKMNSGTVFFTGDAIDVDGEIRSYNWSISNGYSSSNSSFSYSFKNIGSFNASFTVIDDKGGISTREISFEILKAD